MRQNVNKEQSLMKKIKDFFFYQKATYNIICVYNKLSNSNIKVLLKFVHPINSF